jgi:hypothetical protein
MTELYYAISHFPGIVPSVLLSVLLVMVLIAVLGLFDIHHTGTDVDFHHHDVDANGLHQDGWLAALGFGRVPIFIILASVIFIWWMLTILGQLHLMPLLPKFSHWIVGSVILGLAFFAAIRLSILVIRPLKPLFNRKFDGARPTDFIGRPCKIVTGSVDQKFGQAEVVIDAGAPHIVHVYAQVPNQLARGSTALILSFDAQLKRYEVEPYNPD